MAGFVCDRCGRPLLVDEDVRYVVKMEVFAAYDPMELTTEDLKRDRRAEIAELIEKMKRMDPQKLEDSVYKSMVFDVCLTCQRTLLSDPLGGVRTDH